MYKLLQGDKGALSLLAENPFVEGPPRFVRAELYQYQFTRFADAPDAWWKRRRVAGYLPPLSTDNPALLGVLESFGWLKGGEKDRKD